MTSSVNPGNYRAFGKLIRSDIELGLLHLASDDSEEPVAHIRLSGEPLVPTGEPIGGDDRLSLTHFREEESVLLALNTTDWIASISPESPVVSVHPDGRKRGSERAEEALRSRILGDRIVTAVVPYLPALWGGQAIHGSLVTNGMSSVVLLGRSGFGKSTLSQLLRREHGWEVVDDDTSMVTSEDDFVVTPMGAMARLRSDAATLLAFSMVELPGYGGHKNAVPRVADDEGIFQEYCVSTVVQLGPFGSEYGGATGELAIEEIPSRRALQGVFESIFVLSPDRAPEVKRQFQLAARLASVPHFVLTYDKQHHSASMTAHYLGEWLTRHLQRTPLTSP